VALAAGTSESEDYDVFIDALLAEPIPEGTFRYYDGMLYMLSLLVLSGQLTPG
jgi:oligosaccharide reducing-end xylanase